MVRKSVTKSREIKPDITVIIKYPMSRYWNDANYDSKIISIAKAHKNFDGTGSDFKTRDLFYYFKDMKAVERLKQRFKNEKGIQIKVFKEKEVEI